MAPTPVDTLLDAARPSLLRWAPAAIHEGAGSALIVTADADGDPLVDLWPVKRIAGMLGVPGELAEQLRAIYSLPRGDQMFLVIVAAPRARPTAIVMQLEQLVWTGWYSVAYVKIERYWHYVWAIWTESPPSAAAWIRATATGSIQQSFDDRTESYAFEQADIDADDALRELLGSGAATVRLDESFARAAWRESLGRRPNYRAPRPGVTQYAPRPGHDRPPTRWAGDHHLELSRLADLKREESDRILARLRGERDTRSPIDRAIDEACKR